MGKLYFLSILSLAALFLAPHQASHAVESKDEEFLQAQAQEDKDYLEALVRLEMMEEGEMNSDSLFRKSSCLSHLIFQFLQINELIKVRRTSKNSYYSDAIKWLALRLNDQIHNQYETSIPYPIRPELLPAISACEIRAVLCMQRRVQQPAMRPTMDELTFIEQKLGNNKNFEVALAYLPPLKGIRKKVLRSLAEAGNPHAQILHARSVGTLIVPFEELAAFGQDKAYKVIAELIYLKNFVQREPEKARIAQLLLELRDFAAKGGLGASVDAQKVIIEALFREKLGFEVWPGKRRFEELMTIATAGEGEAHRYAQDFVADALNLGSLGQQDRPWEERFAVLCAMATAGNLKAQEHVANRVYSAHPYVDGRKSESFALLEGMANAGNRFAQKFVVDTICFEPSRFLNREDCLEERRFARLKDLAKADFPHAKRNLAKAILRGGLNRLVVDSEKVGFEEIRAMAREGCPDAQRCMLDVLFEMSLDGMACSENQPRLELEAFANGGSSENHFYAQELVKALKRAEALPVLPSPFKAQSKDIAEGVARLKAMVAFGNKKESRRAQMEMIRHLCRGTNGECHRDKRQRFLELQAIAACSDFEIRQSAQYGMAMVLVLGWLGQEKRHLLDRLKEVQALAATGNREVQDLFTQHRGKAAEPGDSAKFIRVIYDFYNAMLESLAPKTLADPLAEEEKDR